MSEKPKLKVLCVGLEPYVGDSLRRHLVHAVYTEIKDVAAFDLLLESMGPETAHLIICGPSFTELPAIELAQAFRSQAPDATIFYAPVQQKNVDFEGLLKNGFNEVFSLPADDSVFGQALRKAERDNTGAGQTVYKTVPVMEFEPNTTVNFSVSIFLPMNQKHVKILKEGSAIREAQVNKFKTHKVKSLCVEEGELDKFISYSAEQMKKLNKLAGSSVVHAQKFQGTVRELFKSLIADGGGNFEEGKSLMKNSQKIVAEFVQVKSAFGLYEKLNEGLDQSDDSIYAHCGRVSTIASLLSLGTKIGQPEDLAVAGLFHDIGKISLSPELTLKRYADMTAEEKKAYEAYPEESLRMLQQKKMGVSEKVRDMILQQCERQDGKGFPKQLPYHKIQPESQLLSLANELDLLCRDAAGQKRLTPEEALNKIAQQGAISNEIINAARPLLIPPKVPDEGL